MVHYVSQRFFLTVTLSRPRFHTASRHRRCRFPGGPQAATRSAVGMKDWGAHPTAAAPFSTRRAAKWYSRLEMATTPRNRALVLLALLLVVAGASALARYVVFPADRIPRGAIVVPRDVATLDAALLRVQSGGTIVLDTKAQPAVGPFVINVAGITLCAIGSPARLAAEGSEPTVAVTADGVTLRNLDVTAETVGISITSTRCQVEGLTVHATSTGVRLSGAQDCTLDRIRVQGGDVGLELSSSGAIKAHAVTVRDVTGTGVRAVGSWSCTLERVEVDHARVGFSLENGTRETVLLNCLLKSCDESGVVVRGSNNIILANTVIRGTPIGVALDQATQCEIRECTIEQPATAGVVLERSLQNRIQGVVIRDPEQSGLRLSESSDNALFNNEIRGGSAVAISLTASDRNLVTRNEIVDTADGIRVDGATSCRILRNTIASRQVGLVLQGGKGGRILDNHVTGGIFGIAVVSSTGNDILRNRVEGQAESAFALLDGGTGNALAENRASRSGVGILVAATSDSSVRDNVIAANEVGVLLYRSGPGLRLEGNRIEKNLVGLRQAGAPEDLPTQLDLLDVSILMSAGETAPPILANNVFSGNRKLDIDNRAQSPFYASGNAWGARWSGSAAAALVSADVDLQASAWKGTLAVGTGAGDVQEMLGHLIRIVLARAGYHVVDLTGMGSAPLVADAIQAGDIDVTTQESRGTGTPSASAGLTAFVLPARSGWVAVVSSTVADQLPERTLSALAAMLRDAGRTLLWTVPQAYGDSALAAFRDAYGFAEQVRAVVWAKTLDEAESVLRFGAAQFALLESLEETVTQSGFVSLEDDRHVVPSGTLAVLARSELLAGHPDVADALSRLAPKLTASALQDLVSRMRLSNVSPEDASMEFLTQEGLIPR